jgi:hypothetical protein
MSNIIGAVYNIWKDAVKFRINKDDELEEKFYSWDFI